MFHGHASAKSEPLLGLSTEIKGMDDKRRKKPAAAPCLNAAPPIHREIQVRVRQVHLGNTAYVKTLKGASTARCDPE